MRKILAAFILFPALAWAGYVNGPSSSVDGDAAVFIGTSGTFIRDGGGSPIVDVPTNAEEKRFRVDNISPDWIA